MRTVTNLVSAVGDIVNRLTLPGREKKQLETDILRLLIAVEEKTISEQAAVVATDRDAGLHRDRSCRNVPESADTLRYLPFLGFTGNRAWRIHHRSRRRTARQFPLQTFPEITRVLILNFKL